MNIKWPDVNFIDVIDKERLSAFRNELKKWKDILAGDDQFSIQNQLLNIAWEDTIYRSFNEGLRLNQKRKQPLKLPASLIDLIHDHYFISQVIFFRRLFEKKARDAKKEVYSLQTLISDINKSAEYITRENYVCYDGTPYSVPNDKVNWRIKATSEDRHKVFDMLSGCNELNRKREDVISLNVLNRLDEELKRQWKRIAYHSNKYYAHASAPSTRKDSQSEPTLLSLRYLQDLYRLSIWITCTLGKITDQLVMVEVPAPQFDQFEGWNECLFDDKIRKRLYKYWRKRESIISGWFHKYWHDFDKNDLMKLSP